MKLRHPVFRYVQVQLFSFINDLTVLYFDIEPALVNLQSILSLISRIVTLIAFCLFGNLLTFDYITILGDETNNIAATLISISILLETYNLVLAGMALSGVASSILI